MAERPKTVLKWTVPVDDQAHPIGAGKVLLVASQYGDPGEVQVWTEESADIGIRPTREATVIGTGQAVPDGHEHIGSVVTMSGALVWHVYAEEQNRG